MNALRLLLLIIALIVVTTPMLLAQGIDKETEFLARLLSPLNTQTNKKRDTVTAQVTSPDAFKGSIFEGKVQESKSGGKIKSTSVLTFTFDKLNHDGLVLNVQSSVKEVVTSKGARNVDEEGRVIEKKNSIGKVALASGIGAIVGAAAGGARGAAIGVRIGAATGLIP